MKKSQEPLSPPFTTSQQLGKADTSSKFWLKPDVIASQLVVKPDTIGSTVLDPHIPVKLTAYCVFGDKPVTSTVTAPPVVVPEAEATSLPSASVVV